MKKFGEVFMKIKTTKLLAVLCTVVMLVTTIIPSFAFTASAAGDPATATLTFDNTSKRITFTTTKQVWTENGVVVTNDKSSSTSNVANYSKPARFYASSKLTIEAPGNITKIVFDCNSSSYATAMKNSIGTVSGGAVSVSSDKVTVTFNSAVESFIVAKLTAQVRMDAITVTYVIESDDDSSCEHENTTTTENKSTCATAGSIVVTCNDCGDEISNTPSPLLEHTPGDAATCTTPQTCTFCGTVITEVIAHAYVDGFCSICETEDPNYRVPNDNEIIFDFGANGAPTHEDAGNNNVGANGKTFDSGDYTLNITSATNVYFGARDAKGNSALKLGTSSKAGSFSFTVPDEVISVIIYVAKYKTDASKIEIDGVTYTLSKNSNDGAYDVIEIDTTTTKTITLQTLSGGLRCMINTIVWVKAPAHEHDYKPEVTAPTCTADGYTTYTCACGDSYVADRTEATGHSYDDGVYTAPTVDADGYTTYTCGKCGHEDVKTNEGSQLVAVAQVGGQRFDSLQAAIDAANAGDEVVLLANVNGGAYINKAITINGEGFTITGTATVEGHIDVVETVKFVNVKFFLDGEVQSARCVSVKAYSEVIFEGCDFTCGATDVYHNGVIGIEVLYNCTVEVKNCNASKLFYMIYAGNATDTNITVDGCTMIEMFYGIGSYRCAATIKNTTYEGYYYGICGQNINTTLDLENVTINASHSKAIMMAAPVGSTGGTYIISLTGDNYANGAEMLAKADSVWLERENAEDP